MHGRSPAAKDRVTKSSGGRVCTSARKVAALRALVKTAIAADAGTKEPSQPKVAHSMPPSAAAPYTRSQGQRASSRNRPAASEATRAPRHRVRLPNAPSKLSGTAAATASAYPEQQPGRQPPRPHRGTTRAPPRNHPRATHGTRPPRKCVTESDAQRRFWGWSQSRAHPTRYRCASLRLGLVLQRLFGKPST